MAFNPEDGKKIKEALTGSTDNQEKENKQMEVIFPKPMIKQKQKETKNTYAFTLYPSTKKKLGKLAEDSGYSQSAYIEKIIDLTYKNFYKE
ncbi:hypothetical protein FOF72_07145 [Lactobacillus jensenii]|jgi:hypothetical protein|uniref:CopG family transcriptional regulator n=1 Tax=Lactobacillus jensenii TaxID=109790 RepID=A0A558JM10_LACJE|nr:MULTISPECIES: hypothetical protein [Lactobacillus]ERJ42880.1 hypothetical protein N581_10165 [Lactobacillus jensenii MD IIE-70(2)]MCZ3543354.1 hypothetical protein [Lactobacillus gasseri]EEX28162.1 hypothetical protein HMPREF0527_00397 [Lactobacillus jensenii SJ-7A-US]KAA9257768.1 hypothetical protein F6I24_06955 [Lactobacillus jensenii]KAA9320160.1 hypothetical protein F6H94_08420 [Lactobacillus jensenii]